MKQLIDRAYIDDTVYNGMTCEVWQYTYQGGEIAFELIPFIGDYYVDVF